MYYAVAMCQVQPGIKQKRICYGSLKIILTVITIAWVVVLAITQPLPTPQWQLLSLQAEPLTLPLEPLPGPRWKTGFGPQLLKVLGVPLPAVIVLRSSPTVDRVSEAVISF